MTNFPKRNVFKTMYKHMNFWTLKIKNVCFKHIITDCIRLVYDNINIENIKLTIFRPLIIEVDLSRYLEL
jgi:hypothetical protein